MSSANNNNNSLTPHALASTMRDFEQDTAIPAVAMSRATTAPITVATTSTAAATGTNTGASLNQLPHSRNEVTESEVTPTSNSRAEDLPLNRPLNSCFQGDAIRKGLGKRDKPSIKLNSQEANNSVSLPIRRSLRRTSEELAAKQQQLLRSSGTGVAADDKRSGLAGIPARGLQKGLKANGHALTSHSDNMPPIEAYDEEGEVAATDNRRGLRKGIQKARLRGVAARTRAQPSIEVDSEEGPQLPRIPYVEGTEAEQDEEMEQQSEDEHSVNVNTPNDAEYPNGTVGDVVRPATTRDGVVQNSSINQGLVEALPVSEVFGGTAELVDVEAHDKTAHLQSPQQKEHQCHQKCCGLMILTCAVILIVILFVVGKEDNGISNAVPTIAPSLPPTELPSMAPTGSLDLLLQNLPTHTFENLENFSTPQWKAHDWLSRHPDLLEMEEWRKVQLFALATFYFAFEGPSWKEVIRKRWLTYEEHECFWWSAEFGEFEGEDGYIAGAFPIGVEPCNGHLEFQNLYLDQLEIVGGEPVIPPEVSFLTSLSVLAISSVNMSCPFEGCIPPEIYQMSQLNHLVFDVAKLSGTLPSEIGVTDIVKLQMGANLFTGTIPSQIGLSVTLEELVLPYNLFTGSIPTQIGMMNMKLMHLGFNSMSGPIPSQIGLLGILQNIFLDHNSLVGTLPSQIGLLRNMETFFNLQNNVLSGMLPSELGQMSNLSEMSMSSNFLTGHFPTQIGLLSNMELLLLFGNLLSGMLPSELGQMSKLRHLSLDYNQISGSIPIELTQINTLTGIWLNNNSLTGMFPHEFETLVLNGTLRRFDVHNNNLSGTVPKGLCLLGPCNYTRGFCSPGLGFDCNDKLCGCDWCPCHQPEDMFMGNDTSTNHSHSIPGPVTNDTDNF